MRFFIYFLLSFQFSTIITFSQTGSLISNNRRVDWRNPGLSIQYPPAYDYIVNIKDFGAVGDSLHYDYNSIKNIINNYKDSTGFKILYFPEGIYKISHALEFENKDYTFEKHCEDNQLFLFNL